MISAWAEKNRLVLGKIKADDKSNEITVLPESLQLLEIKDCVVTIDAMGCQRHIAEVIDSTGGSYVLALKATRLFS